MGWRVQVATCVINQWALDFDGNCSRILKSTYTSLNVIGILYTPIGQAFLDRSSSERNTESVQNWKYRRLTQKKVSLERFSCISQKVAMAAVTISMKAIQSCTVIRSWLSFFVLPSPKTSCVTLECKSSYAHTLLYMYIQCLCLFFF